MSDKLIQTACDISVIICAYTEKRWQALVAAIESVQHQTLPAREIILVIDHNPALFQQAQASLADIIIIENSRDKGLSGARNSGWTRAQGEIIAFLDDDAVAEPDWIENVAAYYTEPTVVGVGGKIVPLWEKDAPFWFPEEFNWVIGCTYRGMPMKKARMRNVIGANMSIRKSILETSGGFRESFGCDKNTTSSEGFLKWFNHSAGDEETEFCIRVSRQLPGCVWLYGAKAVVRHRVSLERTRWRYFLWRCYDEGLGKANLVRLHTSDTGLSSERAYVLQSLPIGVIDNMADTFLHRDSTGLSRAGAILLGFTTTVLGYFIGSISSHLPFP
jgi:glycosyltransferase involved in cell wall biosynthesis